MPTLYNSTLISLFLSIVIARVKNFLPVMAAANKQLENEISKNCPDEFDIENFKEDMQYVEMVSVLSFALQ